MFVIFNTYALHFSIFFLLLSHHQFLFVLFFMYEQLLFFLCALHYGEIVSINSTKNPPYLVCILSGLTIPNFLTFPTIHTQTCLELIWEKVTVMDVFNNVFAKYNSPSFFSFQISLDNLGLCRKTYSIV